MPIHAVLQELAARAVVLWITLAAFFFSTDEETSMLSAFTEAATDRFVQD